jgi:hypothetical protein
MLYTKLNRSLIFAISTGVGAISLVIRREAKVLGNLGGGKEMRFDLCQYYIRQLPRYIVYDPKYMLTFHIRVVSSPDRHKESFRHRKM